MMRVCHLLHNVNLTWKNIRSSLEISSTMELEHSGQEKVCNIPKVKIKVLNWLMRLFHFLLVFDATGKFPDGILAGNFNALGSYTSCLDVDGQYLQRFEPVKVK